ncbi:hypothetical protein M9Y10_010831 [Tritrichomonas musculus]|uniref:Uncharacterized protein n=1 Tax=Tritrichomonas musculus TaxID=1915356 RepID=A0ABR2INP1_9EUKA
MTLNGKCVFNEFPIPSHIIRKHLIINSNTQINDPYSLFLNALMNVTSLSFEIGYINQASALFIFRKVLKDMLSIAVSINYDIDEHKSNVFSQENEHQSHQEDLEKLQTQENELQPQKKECIIITQFEIYPKNIYE